MPQSLIKILAHVVFSTKNRADLIAPQTENELFAYFHGIVENNDSKPILANGTTIHVHLLVSLGKTVSLSELIGDIKRDSSKWIKQKARSFVIFIGKKVTGHSLLVNHKLKTWCGISKIKNNIMTNRILKMSFERCCKGMRLNLTSVTFGIDVRRLRRQIVVGARYS